MKLETQQSEQGPVGATALAGPSRFIARPRHTGATPTALRTSAVPLNGDQADDSEGVQKCRKNWLVEPAHRRQPDEKTSD